MPKPFPAEFRRDVVVHILAVRCFKENGALFAVQTGTHLRNSRVTPDSSWTVTPPKTHPA